jgi:hypothetical protein
VKLAAVLALDDLPDMLRRVGLGQVDGDHRRAAELGRELVKALLTPCDKDQLDVRLAREPPGGRLADPARGSRDDGDVRHRSRKRIRALIPTSHSPP